MTNPINNINRGVTDSVNGNAKAAKPQSTPQTESVERPESTEDRVSLSDESIQLTELRAKIDDIPEVDEEKVNAIKQEIAKGNYPVDPEKIVENLLNLEKSLSE
jgi:negative regulator of flagellin synthesis FlgM